MLLSAACPPPARRLPLPASCLAGPPPACPSASTPCLQAAASPPVPSGRPAAPAPHPARRPATGPWPPGRWPPGCWCPRTPAGPGCERAWAEGWVGAHSPAGSKQVGGGSTQRPALSTPHMRQTTTDHDAVGDARVLGQNDHGRGLPQVGRWVGRASRLAAPRWNGALAQASVGTRCPRAGPRARSPAPRWRPAAPARRR